MKAGRIVIFCVSLIVLPVFIESCCEALTSCPCKPDWVTNFSIKSFSVTTESATGGQSPSPAPLSKYSFHILLDADYRKAQLLWFTPTMGAYACEPQSPKSDQKITELTIRSNNALTTTDGTYAAGEDLAELFTFLNYGEELEINGLYETNVLDAVLFVTSKKAVDVPQHHQFKIHIKLDDGRTFDITTEEFDLTPEPA